MFPTFAPGKKSRDGSPFLRPDRSVVEELESRRQAVDERLAVVRDALHQGLVVAAEVQRAQPRESRQSFEHRGAVGQGVVEQVKFPFVGVG